MEKISLGRLQALQHQLYPPVLPNKDKVWSKINVDPLKAYTAEPLRVAITGGAGQIAYSLAFLVARGQMLGLYQPVIIHLVDLPQTATALKGVSMELQDCAFPLLKGVVIATDPKTGFSGVNVAVLVGSFPRKVGMQRSDLLIKNGTIFKAQGTAVNEFADKDVRILVVGNPANTNALIFHHFAPEIPKNHITCMTRLDHNRAKAQVAERLGVPTLSVHNVFIWGNHSASQYPDVRFGFVKDFPKKGLTTPIESLINDSDWLRKSFVPIVQQRGAKVIEARKLSSAASAATAACDHIRDWLLGTPCGEVVSMGMVSEGKYYGVIPDLVFSFPVTCCHGEYKVVENLPLDKYSEEMIKTSEKELSSERSDAFSLLGISP
jgi:malate dehydrogenase